jgi:hypothetical protein
MTMQCEQFEQILEQQDERALPALALAHLEGCEACRSLSADFDAIRESALELGSAVDAPPERVWISLRNQLEAEGLIHVAQVSFRSGAVTRASWWALFQRPAIAGCFLGLILAAAGALGYLSNVPPASVESQVTPPQEISPTLTADNVFKEEILTVGIDSASGAPRPSTAVAASIRRNLQVVDNLIAMCEKSVHEQPDNQMARDYLYGAYQQKAELLAAAMNRGTIGGLQ